MVKMASTVLIRIFGEVIESRYRKYVSGAPVASFKDIVIGSRYTWHGRHGRHIKQLHWYCSTRGDPLPDEEESEEAVAQNAPPTLTNPLQHLCGGKN